MFICYIFHPILYSYILYNRLFTNLNIYISFPLQAPQKDSKNNTQSPCQSRREDLNDRLKQALNRPNMTEDEQFLVNYIFKQK